MSAERLVFLDTNILIYAHDRDAGRRHARAAEVVEELWTSRAGVVSSQVLQEFYVTVTRTIPRPLPKSTAREIVEDYRTWPCQLIGPEEILDASRLEERHRLSFWDALILSAASRAGAGRILSEDFTHGRVLAGVRVENPFLS